MTLKLALAVLLAATLPASAQTACGVGQNCPNGNQAPFPVINPLQGLANILNLPQNNNQPPKPPMSANGLAPVAMPPPVLPPGINR